MPFLLCYQWIIIIQIIMLSKIDKTIFFFFFATPLHHEKYLFFIFQKNDLLMFLYLSTRCHYFPLLSIDLKSIYLNVVTKMHSSFVPFPITNMFIVDKYVSQYLSWILFSTFLPSFYHLILVDSFFPNKVKISKNYYTILK